MIPIVYRLMVPMQFNKLKMVSLNPVAVVSITILQSGNAETAEKVWARLIGHKMNYGVRLLDFLAVDLITNIERV